MKLFIGGIVAALNKLTPFGLVALVIIFRFPTFSQTRRILRHWKAMLNHTKRYTEQ